MNRRNDRYQDKLEAWLKKWDAKLAARKQRALQKQIEEHQKSQASLETYPNVHA